MTYNSGYTVLYLGFSLTRVYYFPKNIAKFRRTVAKTVSPRRSEFGGGPRSETGSRSRRESERAREGGVVKSGRGRSEAAGARAKWGEKAPSIAFSCPWLGKESRFIYMYSTCSERGRTGKGAKRGMVVRCL